MKLTMDEIMYVYQLIRREINNEVFRTSEWEWRNNLKDKLLEEAKTLELGSLIEEEK